MARDLDKQAQGTSNREWGALAENIAADYLIKQGYTIRERNFRMRHIEIDLIAEKDNEIVFVEVKARSSDYVDALYAVDKQKQNKMLSGADMYLRALPVLYWYRFDIITITGTKEDYKLEHYPDAFISPLRTRVHPRPSRPSNRRKTKESDEPWEEPKPKKPEKPEN